VINSFPPSPPVGSASWISGRTGCSVCHRSPPCAGQFTHRCGRTLIRPPFGRTFRPSRHTARCTPVGILSLWNKLKSRRAPLYNRQHEVRKRVRATLQSCLPAAIMFPDRPDGRMLRYCDPADSTEHQVAHFRVRWLRAGRFETDHPRAYLRVLVGPSKCGHAYGPGIASP
jgi:hypothetical protein